MLILIFLQTGKSLRGDGNDFEELFRQFYRPVVGFFAKRGTSNDECQDLAQETFLRAFRAFADFRGDARPSTWLFAIAANLWSNRNRDAAAAKRDGAEVPLPEDGWAEPESGDRADERADAAERLRLLRSAIDDLPPQMRRCVQLRVYQGRGYRDVAEILGVTVETAKSQVSLAKKRLRQSLAHHYPELEDDADGPGG